MWGRGEGGERDTKMELDYYGLACNNGEPKACHNLGVMFNRGEGVKKDPEKAKAYYTRACEGGHRGSCAKQ